MLSQENKINTVYKIDKTLSKNEKNKITINMYLQLFVLQYL